MEPPVPYRREWLASQQRSAPEISLEELEAGLVQSDPTYSDSKPPSGSTNEQIIDFLRTSKEQEQVADGKEVNSSRAEQDQWGPRASRRYLTTVEMILYQNAHLGYWKEKKVETHGSHLDRGTSWPQEYYGLKVTFQFHRCDGGKTNWFMHDYIPTESWGIDMYLKVRIVVCYVFFNARF